MDKRPNIIFVMTDDHAAQAMSCYGSEVNQTPNLDRIANEGMRFENCYCTNSICAPSRAVILSGMHSHKNGVRVLGERLDRDKMHLPLLLKDSGYQTAMIGKWHLAGDRLEGHFGEGPGIPRGFDYWNILPGQGEYNNPTMIENGVKKKEKGYVTDIITDHVLDYLDKRDKERPFFMMYHHKAPHDPWIYDEKHAHLYEDYDLPEPLNLFDNYDNRAEAIRMCTQKIGMKHTRYEKETAHLSGDDKKRAQYQLYMKSYCRTIASVDDNMGRLLDYLDENDLTENTVTIYTSDQGFFLGEHGLYDKRFMYEESLRMPFVIRFPKMIKPESVNRDLVQNIDFAQTMLDLAGIQAPDFMQGESLKPILEGYTPDDWRQSVYYRYWMHLAHFNIPAHIGVRTKDYKLIYYYGQSYGCKDTFAERTMSEWELFDQNKDPMEMNNVYYDPEYADIIKDLKVELKKLRVKCDDDDFDFNEHELILKKAFDPNELN